MVACQTLVKYYGIKVWQRVSKRWIITGSNGAKRGDGDRRLVMCPLYKDVRKIRIYGVFNEPWRSTAYDLVRWNLRSLWTPPRRIARLIKRRSSAEQGTYSLIRRLGNKGKLHQWSLTDPEREVARWLETKSGSGVETTIHVACCGAFHGQKQFGRNCWRGASGVGSYISKVDLLKNYFLFVLDEWKGLLSHHPLTVNLGYMQPQ